jgi:hypothetical protein
MHAAQRLLPVLILAAALGGGARAAEPDPIATAPPATSGAPPSVADQIDAYLKSSPAAALPKDAASGVTAGKGATRAVHGVADVAVGSNGDRSAFVRGDIPVGESATVSIAVGETRLQSRRRGDFGGEGLTGSRRSLSLGFAGAEAVDPRCRRPGEASADPRFDAGPRLGCGPIASSGP